MNTKSNVRTGEALVEAGVLTPEQLTLCLHAQALLKSQNRNMPLGEIVLGYGLASRKEVDDAVRRSGNLGAGLTSVQIPPSILRQFSVMPLGFNGHTAQLGALNGLTDADKRALVESYREAGVDINAIEEVPWDRRAVYEYLHSLSHVDKEVVQQEVANFCGDHTNAVLLNDLVHHIIHEALQSRASDIHIDRSANLLMCWISYRIDNELKRRHMLTVPAMAAFATRIKLNADMDSSDKNRPLDGRWQVEFHGRQIDLRIASRPSDDGECIVIRLRDQSAIQTIEETMAEHPVVARWAKSVANVRGKEGGLVLVTGPTGSGKSTTLVAMMRSMRRDVIKVLTAEDPVEIKVPLVSQSRINEAAGLGYAEMIRAFMRQDPDVMVIGEIRDQKTASEVMKGAETGHALFSTLHTNNVIDSIKRTISLLPSDQMTIGLFTLAHRLKLIINQRLALRLCTCSEEVALRDITSAATVRLIELLGLDRERGTVRKKVGCRRCEHTGYYDRVLMAEAVWFPTDAATREQMEAALCKSTPNVSALLKIPSVQHYSKEKSIARLLAIGAIDLDVAQVLADIHEMSLSDDPDETTRTVAAA